ncbi:MAG: hypothetical protein ACRC9G_15050, partial [Aeromonas veronii]
LKVMAYFKISLSTRNWDRAFFMGVMLAWTGSNYPFCGSVATVQADYAMKRSTSLRQHFLSIPAIGYPGLAWPGWIGIMAACRIEEIV